MIWISLPHLTIGLVVEAGRVVDAPPIARWAIGRDAEGVVAYFARKPGSLIDTI